MNDIRYFVAKARNS